MQRLQKQSGLFLKEGFLCLCLRYWILVHQQHVEIPSGGGWVKGIFHSEIDSFCCQHGNHGMGYNNIINIKTKETTGYRWISYWFHPPSGFHEQRHPELTRQITFSQHFYEQPNAAQVLLHFFCHKVRPNPDVCPFSRIISRQEIWRMIISFIDVPVSNTGCMKCLWHVKSDYLEEVHLNIMAYMEAVSGFSVCLRVWHSVGDNKNHMTHFKDFQQGTGPHAAIPKLCRRCSLIQMAPNHVVSSRWSLDTWPCNWSIRPMVYVLSRLGLREWCS